MKKMLDMMIIRAQDRLTAQIFGYALGEININDKGRERKYIFRHIRDDNIKTILETLT